MVNDCQDGDRPRREMRTGQTIGIRVDLARAAGFGMFGSMKDMMAELRRGVILKMIRQAHEAELAEPGDPPSSAIVGTPEW